MKRRRYRRRRVKRLLLFLILLVACALCFSCVAKLLAGNEPSALSAGGTTATGTTATAPTTSSQTQTAFTVANPFADSGLAKLSLGSENLFVFDTSSGLQFYKGDMTARIYPASITKLYTAYVALKYVDPAEVITAGDELSLVQPGSSLAFVSKGHRLKAEMLVEGMLLPSGNDAAYVLAAAAGRHILGEGHTAAEQVEAFVNAMNSHAQLNGLKHTHFVNPDGFHNADHYTTMADMMRIAQLVLTNETILQYTGLTGEKVFFESGEHIEWHNTNALLYTTSPYYHSNVIGLKTGYTEEAGYCLLTAAKTMNSTVIIGAFGNPTADGRFADTDAVLDWIASRGN